MASEHTHLVTRAELLRWCAVCKATFTDDGHAMRIHFAAGGGRTLEVTLEVPYRARRWPKPWAYTALLEDLRATWIYTRVAAAAGNHAE